MTVGGPKIISPSITISPPRVINFNPLSKALPPDLSYLANSLASRVDFFIFFYIKARGPLELQKLTSQAHATSPLLNNAANNSRQISLPRGITLAELHSTTGRVSLQQRTLDFSTRKLRSNSRRDVWQYFHCPW